MESTITKPVRKFGAFGSAVQSRLPLASVATKQLNIPSTYIFQPYPLTHVPETSLEAILFLSVLGLLLHAVMFFIAADYQRSLKMLEI